MATKTPPAPTPRKKRADATDLKSVLVRLDPRQDDALREEALRVARLEKSARPDKSRIVRAALDAYPPLKLKR